MPLSPNVEDFYRKLGKRIALYRRSRDWTQEELGAKLVPVVNRASIANVEGGKQRVLAHTLGQMADVFGVQVEVFFRDESNEIDLEAALEEIERAKAGRVLVSANIYTKSGKLRKAYGG